MNRLNKLLAHLARRKILINRLIGAGNESHGVLVDSRPVLVWNVEQRVQFGIVYSRECSALLLGVLQVADVREILAV